jgi:hypothetical protein
VVQRVDSIRQPDLLERPLRAEVFGLAAPLGKDGLEAIERDHVVLRFAAGFTGPRRSVPHRPLPPLIEERQIP